MAATTNLFQGVLYINFANNGWSEKYHLPSASYTEAKVLFAAIVAWRAAILSTSCTIIWARISVEGNPREAIAAIDAPIPGLQQTPASSEDFRVNDPSTAFHFRFETETGRHTDRLLRGLPDHWVKAGEIDPQLLPVTPIDPLPAIAEATADRDLIRGFITVVRNNTVQARKTNANPLTFEIENFTTVIYRGRTTRKTGRPFGMHRGRAAART